VTGTTSDGDDGAERWRDEASCKGLKPGIFVPPIDVPESVAYAFARQVCDGCPVRLDCLEYALARGHELNRNVSGMWGGRTPRERRRIVRMRKKHNITKGHRT
jgi:WhiB family transcriptional regulator, redox-sensing transcriptional regulator